MKIIIKCCPMLEKYEIWVDDKTDVCFINIHSFDYTGNLDVCDYKSEPINYCPFCSKQIKTKED